MLRSTALPVRVDVTAAKDAVDVSFLVLVVVVVVVVVVVAVIVSLSFSFLLASRKGGGFYLFRRIHQVQQENKTAIEEGRRWRRR